MNTTTREPGTELGSLRCVAILPARLGSTRLPRKMLLAETGTPLIVHAARNAARCAAFERVVVATDSEEVREACDAHGVDCTLTRADHPSGTDRVHEAYHRVTANGEAFDVVVNVQGDEPDVEPDDLQRLCAAFRDADVHIATLCAPVEDEASWRSPHVVKVLRDARGDALYFSRAPIPSADHAREPGDAPHRVARRHLGVYAFRPAALERCCALPPSSLERLESLEQLRWLEAGESLRVLSATHVPCGIDTAEDYRAFVRAQASAPAAPSDRPGPSTRPTGTAPERQSPTV